MYKVISTARSKFNLTAYCDDLKVAYALAEAIDGIVLKGDRR